MDRISAIGLKLRTWLIKLSPHNKYYHAHVSKVYSQSVSSGTRVTEAFSKHTCHAFVRPHSHWYGPCQSWGTHQWRTNSLQVTAQLLPLRNLGAWHIAGVSTWSQLQHGETEMKLMEMGPTLKALLLWYGQWRFYKQIQMVQEPSLMSPEWSKLGWSPWWTSSTCWGRS